MSGSLPDDDVTFTATSLAGNSLTLRLNVPGQGTCNATYAVSGWVHERGAAAVYRTQAHQAQAQRRHGAHPVHECHVPVQA